MKKIHKNFPLFVFALAFVTCGGSAATSTTAAEEGAVFSALASVFSGSGSSDTPALVRYLADSRGEICDGLWESPTGILTTPSESADTYGSASDNVVLALSDFCENHETETENTGDGPDGNGRFAAFLLLQEVTGACVNSDNTSAGTATLLAGSGVTRNRYDATSGDVTTEVFGTFQLNTADQVVSCALVLLNGELQADESSCSDRAQNNIDLSTGVTCSMNADLPDVTETTVYHGHYSLDRDTEALNLAFSCDNVRDALTTYTNANIRYIDNDCTFLDTYGINIEGLGIGINLYDPDTTNSTVEWTFVEAGGTISEVANRIKLLHRAGVQIQFSVDINYQLSSTSSGDANQFPQAMVDDPEFQQDLAELIVDYARVAEHLGVEIFAPLSEDERIFELSTTTTGLNFLQSIRSEIEAVYSGKLLYMAYDYESADPDDYNFTGYDVLGVDISPGPNGIDGIQTEAEFQAHVNEQLANMQAISQANGNIPFYITNGGIWGGATETTNPIDWTSADNALRAFEIMFDASDTYGAAGMMPWEGAAGEVVFSDYPNILQEIIDRFVGTE